jgi:hypothetical protein
VATCVLGLRIPILIFCGLVCFWQKFCLDVERRRELDVDGIDNERRKQRILNVEQHFSTGSQILRF